MTVKGILVTMLVPMENHIANGGEKLLGNASSIKRRPDGKVYISGQMQRHVLFSAMDRLNEDDSHKGETYISNGDGIGNAIELDIRADLGGFMHPNKGDYSGRRIAPLSVTPAVALEPSEIGRDLMLRLSTMDRNNAVATREFSQGDMMHMNFSLDVGMVGVSKVFHYHDNFSFGSSYIQHIGLEEKLRRTKLFIDSTRMMNDYANQARNAVSGEPQQVLIVFDTKLSRKAARYFVAGENEKQNILEELDAREAKYFAGNDISGEMSVSQAYESALSFLNSENLYNPCPPESEIKTFAEAFETEK
ncbi:type I-PGING CRISPR-associated protein Cas7/Csp1 [Cruoricaptor ignavus]|uniref:Type I-PGING CRISPR-associated protein Cas7/Csp1 n=1 Tax=Cruoricaptor ignavus TaxID=1118202 RepID=A0A7M1T0G8_9FLAO|nr:type I-PGING CRISPR-associated protein Cas7/Csp1 [Cruoricaptor ignavus]QOR73285.1 type I-PGING CRISPR-associated protein Cas7/Csp1 [Cruoricaptor ignavus]